MGVTGFPGGYDQKYAAAGTGVLDLTLKLGLPNIEHPQLGEYPTSSVPLPLPCHSTTQAANEYGEEIGCSRYHQVGTREDHNHVGHVKSTPNQITWSPVQIGVFPQYYMINSNAARNHFTYPSYSHHNSFTSGGSLPSSTTIGGYTVLNNTPGTGTGTGTGRSGVGGDVIGSSTTQNRRGSRRQHDGVIIHNDPNKRCTNFYCNTNDTPMWRKGPLGPKTLCNACGIKYRKEEDKKRAKAAASSSSRTI
ncbi:hypothetical protein Tsubulata_047968 [Turnera subulata]|uniref:GATA-type domain-containing protein n=1 Tax=Turnera subulata TaxID=218843 RepID=A0A9Q0GB70_9ROSI|nr:hypothetical protein Tsubulata_047968 [Turnera subulata]